MRIAVDMHFLQDKHQGIKTCLIGLYEEVCRLSTEHSFLFLFSHDDEVSNRWREFGDVAFIGTESRSQRLGFRMARTIARIGNIDISHFSGVVPWFVPGKVLLTVHDILFETHPQLFPAKFRLQQQMALRWSLKQADIITAVSHYTSSSIRQRFPNLTTPIKVIPNGVYPQKTHQEFTEAKAYVARHFGMGDFFLIVGRIDPRKNHKNMIRAYNALADSLKGSLLPALVIVGNVDNNYHEGAQIIESAQRSLPVHWLQDINDKLLKMLYSASLCVISASYGEGFGLPLLEAMSAGAPVIGSNNTAVPEVTEGCGLLVDPYIPESIMDAMRRIVTDKSLREDMRRRGLEVSRRKTWRHSAIKFVELLDNV